MLGCSDSGRVAVGGSLAVKTFDGIEELLLDRGEFRFGGFGGRNPGEGLTADGRGNLQGAGDLGQSHLVQLFVAEGFEKTLSGRDEFLGGLPFLLAEAMEAAGPLASFLALAGGLVLGLLLQQAGVESQQAFAPAIFAGPVFDGGQAFAQFVGDGLVGAGLAELKEGQESGKGARGSRRGSGGRVVEG